MLPKVTSNLWQLPISVPQVLGLQVFHHAWLSRDNAVGHFDHCIIVLLFFVETEIYLRMLISVTNGAYYLEFKFKFSENGMK